MLDNLTYDEARAAVNTKFRLSEAVEIFELELIEVTERVITATQEMFSLFFCGANEFKLPQGTYELSHEKLGTGAVFLVPVAQDEARTKYEAAFNRLLGAD